MKPCGFVTTVRSGSVIERDGVSSTLGVGGSRDFGLNSETKMIGKSGALLVSRIYQAEGTACAKALGQEGAGWGWGQLRLEAAREKDFGIRQS